jgi:hypothetical protein
MSPSDLKKALSPICGSSVWVEQVAATFPHSSPASVLTAMDKIWWSLGKSDYLEAFSAHPRIGDAAALKKVSPWVLAICACLVCIHILTHISLINTFYLLFPLN